MILAIPSSGPDPTDLVDPHFGRAPWFLTYDTAAVSFAAFDNPVPGDVDHGAGELAARRLADLGADIILTRHCCTRSSRALARAGLEILAAGEGSVLEAVRAWQKGRLKPHVPSAPSHSH